MDTLNRITVDPAVMGGKACVRGLRVTVGMIVGQIGAGVGVDELLADYHYLERQDVMQALRYAAWRAEERELVLSPTDEVRHRHETVLTMNELPKRARPAGDVSSLIADDDAPDVTIGRSHRT